MADNWHYIDIVTKLVNPDVLGSTQETEETPDNQKTTVSNTLVVAVNGDTSGDGAGSKEALIIVENPLIKKKVAQSYSRTDGTIRWEITVNENNIGIQNPVITDTLPKELMLQGVNDAGAVTMTINSTSVTLTLGTSSNVLINGNYVSVTLIVWHVIFGILQMGQK